MNGERKAPIRVLIAEDSGVTRQLLTLWLGETREFEVVAAAVNGAEAVKFVAQHRPDVVLMDLHMPVMDGLAATRAIMEATPTPIVMASASLHTDEMRRTLDALEAGALVILPKPGASDMEEQSPESVRFLTTLRLMSEVKVVRRWPARKPAEPQPSAGGHGGVACVAIGASTGGPGIVAEIIAKLPADLGAFLVLVQHMTDGFQSAYGNWLAGRTKLAVKLASDATKAEPGALYIAPEGRHLVVAADGTLRLVDGPKDEGFCPSANRLFKSVAGSFGNRSLGIVLSGMGRDGATGLLAMRESGAVTVAQDEDSCVVYGMPREASEIGAARFILAPQQIAALIRSTAAAGGEPGSRT